MKGGRKDRYKGCSPQDILSLKTPSQVPTNPLDRLAVSGTSLLRAEGAGEGAGESLTMAAASWSVLWDTLASASLLLDAPPPITPFPSSLPPAQVGPPPQGRQSESWPPRLGGGAGPGCRRPTQWDLMDELLGT